MFTSVVFKTNSRQYEDEVSRTAVLLMCAVYRRLVVRNVWDRSPICSHVKAAATSFLTVLSLLKTNT